MLLISELAMPHFCNSFTIKDSGTEFSSHRLHNHLQPQRGAMVTWRGGGEVREGGGKLSQGKTLNGNYGVTELRADVLTLCPKLLL